MPSPLVTNRPTPSGSLRSWPSDGALRTVTSCWPSGAATIVVEPPPSRFMAMVAPRPCMIWPIWVSVGPGLNVWRPSVVTNNMVLPPSLKPIAVRGATEVSPCGLTWPSVTSGVLEPSANFICCATASFNP